MWVRRIERFSEIFRFICEEAIARPITLVIDEFQDTIEFVEVKRDAERIRLDALRDKTEAFFEKNPDKRSRTISYRGFSIGDM